MRKLAEIAIFTTHVAEIATFYETMLGAPPSYRTNDMAVFSLPGDITLLIHYQYPPVEGQPPNESHIAFAADDVRAACAELTAGGMTLLLEPRRYDWGTSAYLRDPDGRLVEVHSV
jgi:catechol 2,3-dioxygenase-like lactoylglutathione lyase family enzyme